VVLVLIVFAQVCDMFDFGDRSEYDIESYWKVVVVFQEWYGQAHRSLRLSTSLTWHVYLPSEWPSLTLLSQVHNLLRCWQWWWWWWWWWRVHGDLLAVCIAVLLLKCWTCLALQTERWYWYVMASMTLTMGNSLL